MFILGMLVMWVICGFIVVIANTFDVSEDVKDFAVGGILWFLPVIVGNKIYNFFKKKD